MNKINFGIMFVLITLLLTFSGCSNSAENKELQDLKNLQNNQVDVNNQNQLNEPPQDKEEIQESPKVSSKNMKRCISTDKNAPVQYTYLIADKEVYEKEQTTGGGIIEKISTPLKICIKDLKTQKWNCVDNTENEFNEYVNNVREQTEGDLSQIMHIECSNVKFDENAFKINSEEILWKHDLSNYSNFSSFIGILFYALGIKQVKINENTDFYGDFLSGSEITITREPLPIPA